MNTQPSSPPVSSDRLAPAGASCAGSTSQTGRRTVWAVFGLGAFAALLLVDTRAWDSLTTSAFQSFPSWRLYRAANAVTLFGSVQLTGALVFWGAWAARRRSGPRAGWWIVLPFLATLVLELLLKVVGPSIRPGVPLSSRGVVWAWFRVPTSYSFPSGHVLRATYVLGMLLAWEAGTRNNRDRPFVLWGLGLIALGLFGVSQVYLGNHWASDVAAGFLLGGSLALAASKHWQW